jgi:hypothetical protein
MPRKKKKTPPTLPRDSIHPDSAAEIIGVSHSRVCGFCRDGRLKGAVLYKRLWWIPRASVVAFAKLNRPSGNPTFRKKKKRR